MIECFEMRFDAEKGSELGMSTRFTTSVLHFPRRWNETAEEIQVPLQVPIQPSVAFHYKQTKHLIEAFQGQRKSYTYARQSSPSVTALENQVNELEQGRSTICFATGMAAITDTFFSLLKAGDHLVVSQFLFGNTLSFFKTLERLGFDVSYVDVTSVEKVEQAINKNTKFFFTETISNPMTLVPDLERIAELLKHRKIFSIIDNTLTTPLLFQPKQLGFTLSMNSLTKYLCGHSSALAGSMTDLGNYSYIDDTHILERMKQLDPKNSLILQIRKKGMRDQGATPSPYAASIISSAMGTVFLRMKQHLANTSLIAKFLKTNSKIKEVFYPGLEDHPQYDRVRRIYQAPGALLSFILKVNSKSDQLKQVIKVMDRFKLILRSTHLGDVRTMAIPVAPTIFHELGTEGRRAIGMDEGLIRLSVGTERVEDLLEDLEQALEIL